MLEGLRFEVRSHQARRLKLEACNSIGLHINMDINIVIRTIDEAGSLQLEGCSQKLEA